MAIIVKQKAEPVLDLFKFGSVNDGNASMKEVLGGKGANLAEIGNLGVRVPDGFTIPCAASVKYARNKAKGAIFAEGYVNGLVPKIKANLAWLEQVYGYAPLVSVRSGARVSMPGMMDTILNVGLCFDNLGYWKEKLGERAALDSFRRLIQMYGSVALGVDHAKFEAALATVKKNTGVVEDVELDATDLAELVSHYLSLIEEDGKEFPQNPVDQVLGAVKAVFESWNNPRAIEYRKINNIPEDWGTAVNIQSMVFGNLNDQSATGVLFTRDPSTGADVVTGEYLVNAQGEDVVAGIRTPVSLADLADWNEDLHSELLALVKKLEIHYRDLQDVEFTIQDGVLYILQTRNGKRSAKAAFKVAYDLAMEGVITKEEAAGRVTQEQLLAVMQDVIDPSFKEAPNYVGIAAGGGLVTGLVAKSNEYAIQSVVNTILVTKETSPDDIAGMNASVGILTATGGLTSHAAVVARGMNKACVVGTTDLDLDSLAEGTQITIDGSTGNVWVGIDVPVIAGGVTPEVLALLGWAANGAATVIDATSTATNFGLNGVVDTDVIVTTALLSDEADCLNDLQTKMFNLGKALVELEANSITVDLSGTEAHYSNADRAFNFMFGLDPIKYQEQQLEFKAGAVANMWPEVLKDKVVFKNAGKYAYLITEAGFKVWAEVGTVADLLNASGAVSVSPEVIDSVFGGKEAFDKIKALVEAANGKKFAAGLEGKYWFEVLGKKVA